ncbi:SDR family oxidoreductase [Gammaproteobacteria bacterium]|nr:SDR family oxidoreductase [Gammaproteobacteria bacterium]
MKLENKVVVVTGGVRDIGRAVSLDLAKHGAKLAINYYGSDEEAYSLKNELAANNVDAFILQGDLTKESNVADLINKTTESFGDEIHGLVNIAGGLVERKKITEMDEEFLNKVMNLNFNSTFLATKYALNFMKSGSSIVNFASQAGRDGGGPGASAYASSKGAIMTFTRAMAKELGPDGIRVNALCPGMISTAFHDTFTKDEVRANVANATPLKREGTPLEMATTVSFLLSDESSFLTGINLDTNGGLVFS